MKNNYIAKSENNHQPQLTHHHEGRTGCKKVDQNLEVTTETHLGSGTKQTKSKRKREKLLNYQSSFYKDTKLEQMMQAIHMNNQSNNSQEVFPSKYLVKDEYLWLAQ